MNKDKQKISKTPLIIILFLFLFGFTVIPPVVIAQDIWYRQIDTIVLQNISENVYLGENATTSYRLQVNGSMYADSYWGDGGNLTNITGVADGYAGDTAHPHNQDLNTTSNVIFGKITGNWFAMIGAHENYIGDDLTVNGTLTIVAKMHSTDADIDYKCEAGYFVGDGGNLTNISCYSYNQDLNTTNDVVFKSVNTSHLGDGGNLTNLTTGRSACRVRLTSTQSVASGGWVKMLLDNEDYDYNNDFSSYKFTVPEDGLYHVSYSVYGSVFANNKFLRASIYKNGAIAGGLEQDISYVVFPEIGDDLILSGSDTFDLSENDYLELYVYHDNGSNRNFGAYTYSNYIAIFRVI